MATKFISLPELAQLLGLPASWLRRAALDGKIPHLPVGRRVMFDPSAVEKALAKLDSPGEFEHGGASEGVRP